MRNYSFDVLKLFLSLLVVFIHIHVPCEISYYHSRVALCLAFS